MPEIAAERRAILDWIDSGKRIDFFLTLHNTETNEYLNAGPDPSPGQRALLQRVFDLWSAGTTFAAAQPRAAMATTTTAGKAGRMDVVQGLYHDRRIPGFEIEMRIGRQAGVRLAEAEGFAAIRSISILHLKAGGQSDATDPGG